MTFFAGPIVSQKPSWLVTTLLATRMGIRTYAYIYIYTRISLYGYVHVCISMFTYVYICLSMHECVHIYVLLLFLLLLFFRPVFRVSPLSVLLLSWRIYCVKVVQHFHRLGIYKEVVQFFYKNCFNTSGSDGATLNPFASWPHRPCERRPQFLWIAFL